MAAVVFFFAAVLAIAGAFGVVTLRNPFYNVLALVVHLLALAALFLLLRAEFVAAAQVVVYAGAVMVLYVFVVAYVGGTQEMSLPQGGGGRGLKVAAPLFCGALFVELCIAVLGSGLKAIDSRGAAMTGTSGFGTPGKIGEALLTKFLFPFEGASILLLVAAVGAVILARRRRGLGDDEVPGVDTSHFHLQRPASSGTMLEAGGGASEDHDPAFGAGGEGKSREHVGTHEGGW